MLLSGDGPRCVGGGASAEPLSRKHAGKRSSFSATADLIRLGMRLGATPHVWFNPNVIDCTGEATESRAEAGRG
jgi:hypothetical protein